jgi:hypothetical protein
MLVLPRAESDWKDHHAKWMRCVVWGNAVEGRLSRDEHVRYVQAHLSQRAGEDEVKTAFTIDDYSGELDLCHHWVQD